MLSRVRGERNKNWSGVDRGWAAAATLVAGICVWGGVGAVLDHLFGTWPAFFAVGAFLGNFAGIYLIYLELKKDEAPKSAYEQWREKTRAA